MIKLVPAGRILFAIAMIGLGLEHFYFQAFVTGRAPPWPDALPGGPIWAILTGIVVVAAGGMILTAKRGRHAAIVLGALIFFWAVLRHIPVVVASDVLSPDWTRAVKALAFFGGALAVAATLPRAANPGDTAFSRFLDQDAAFILTGTICLAVFMINNGIQHFIYTDFVASLIPSWFPGDPVFWTWFSAIALFAGALGMLYRPTAYVAALLTGIMVSAWVLIVHLPRTLTSVSDNIAIFEATAIAGIAFVLAGCRRRTQATSSPPR